ncbi:MAG TPA: serine hydrolase domain-containing protein [Stellaceae bacterium]|nr:serine hydrolase domain-containing protein [Stellaceae bacterium]
MKRILAFLLALCLSGAASAQSLAPAKPEEVGLSSERLAKIGTVFNEEIERGRIPGAVIAVARKGRLVYFESFGFRDKASGAPMPKDAIFRIYSMTKPLATVAAMMLMEDGKIQLADPVAKYLPEFAHMEVSVPRLDPFGKAAYSLIPAEHPMTIQDLMRHTAGLAYGEITANPQIKEAFIKAGLYRPDVRDFDVRDLQPAEEVTRLAKIPLVHEPGTVWEYSLAVDVLGRVVEKVSGQRLGDFIEKRIAAPLKLKDTGFTVPAAALPRLAEPLAIDPATGNPNHLIDVTAIPGNDSGGAGGVSTASDYLRFIEALLEGGKLEGVRILSRTSVALMTSDQLGSLGRTVTPGEALIGSPGYSFGLGFAVRLGPGLANVAGSEGEFMWAGAAGTYFWVDPREQLVAVMMTQAPGPSRPWYRREIKELVYQAIID